MKRPNYSIGLANDKSSRNLYGIVQQEVDFGVQALKRESADIAVTLFQSALQKLTVGQPFYDHLVHNLLLSYKLLIEQFFKTGDADANWKDNKEQFTSSFSKFKSDFAYQ